MKTQRYGSGEHKVIQQSNRDGVSVGVEVLIVVIIFPNNEKRFGHLGNVRSVRINHFSDAQSTGTQMESHDTSRVRLLVSR